MLDRNISLTGPRAKPSALPPASCVARVEIKGAINEGYGYIDVGLEVAENEGRVAEDNGVVVRSLKRPTRQIESVLTVPLWIFAPAIHIKILVQKGRLRESQSIVRAKLECLPEQMKRAHRRLPFQRKSLSLQVKVVCGEIIGRPLG